MSEIPIVVIGLGNPLLSDDTAGLHAVTRLRNEIGSHCPDVLFCERYSGGMELLSDLTGKTHALIIDAIIDPALPPGEVCEISWGEIQKSEQNRFASAHGLNLPTVVSLGKKLGFTMPHEIAVFAIGGRNFETFSETPTPEVDEGVDKVLALAKQRVYNWKNRILF